MRMRRTKYNLVNSNKVTYMMCTSHWQEWQQAMEATEQIDTPSEIEAQGIKKILDEQMVEEFGPQYRAWCYLCAIDAEPQWAEKGLALMLENYDHDQ